MTKDILLELPYVDQLVDTKNKRWAERTCGICSFKMILGFVKPKLFTKVKIMDLVRHAVKSGGYIENIGWKHSAITTLGEKYGLKMKFQKKFPRTQKEKIARLSFINKNIQRGKPIIASVYRKFEPGKGGHLIVVSGLRLKGKNVVGYHISDPYRKDRGANYFVSKKEFLKGWRGGLIWLI